jgi:hypothetical protein
MPELNPLHFCRGCGSDFSSLKNFDRHRTGNHALNWPAHENGRRCLDTEELRELGFALDARGRWHDPERAARVGEHFQKAA